MASKTPSWISPTIAADLRAEGDQHLRRAARAFPDATPLQALVRSVGTGGVIKGSTVRVYRRQLGAAVDTLIEQGEVEPASREEVVHELFELLEERRGIPDQPRTSSRKVKDVTVEEARKVFAYLAKLAQGEDDIQDVCMVALYIYLVPRVGCRPIEWMDAVVVGEILDVRNAKFDGDRAAYERRQIPLHAFSPLVIRAIAAFANLAPISAKRAPAFRHWRNRLADRLAQACKACEVRRLSLYSFRHVAIATWKAAGLDPWTIAALAGHAARKSQGAYAGKNSGWKIVTVDKAEQGRPEALEARAAERNSAKDATEQPADRAAQSDLVEWDFDDIPVQRPQKSDEIASRRSTELAAEMRRKAELIAQSVVNEHALPPASRPGAETDDTPNSPSL